ncbi:hypothetical protein HID58_095552, partial [Brassica napus]
GEQLKTMVHDGNKQYGWTNIEPKYTSTAPELYRHLLAEERGISAMDTCLFGNPLNIHDLLAKLKNDAWDLLYQVIDEKVKVIKRD